MPPKAKSGEGIIIVVDVGPGVRAGTGETFYSQAKVCLRNILQRKIFADKCKDLVGIVLFGTDETNNQLADDDQYQHVSVLLPPRLVDFGTIAKVDNLPRGNSSGDWLDALVVAMDLLHESDDHNSYTAKKIVLVTDFSGEFSDDEAGNIISGFKKMTIDLSVIGPEITASDTDGFPDSSGRGASPQKKLNWNGKPKSQQQLAAESLITHIVNEVDGIICNFDEAIGQLIYFEKKSSGSASWNAMMDIGRDFQIPITGRIKVRHSTLPTWKRAYGEDMKAAVMKEVSYHLSDDSHTAVEDDEIISGYHYGTTLVPFSDEDLQLKYTCDCQAAALSILGFTKSSYAPLHYRAGDQVLVITARDEDEVAALALSSFIQGLAELDMVAVTRRVYRKGLNPTLGVLVPDITPDYECLIWIGLPFSEDVRSFAFPPLQKTMDRLTEEQKNAMDKLIEEMDVSASDDADEEFLDLRSVVNPQIQHFYNCLTQRALIPELPLPEPAPHVYNILNTPEVLQNRSAPVMKKLEQLFTIQKTIREKHKPNLLQSAAVTEEKEQEHSGIVTSVDLTGAVVTRISTATPVQDFEALLRETAPNYFDICHQMESVILQIVDQVSADAPEDVLIKKIMECIKVFRRESVTIDPGPFNSFVTKLKSHLGICKLFVLWNLMKEESLGVISSSENLKSTYTDEDVNTFLASFEMEPIPPAGNEAAPVADYDEMLDDL